MPEINMRVPLPRYLKKQGYTAYINKNKKPIRWWITNPKGDIIHSDTSPTVTFALQDIKFFKNRIKKR